MGHLIVQRLDGKEYKLVEEMGLKLIDFYPESPTPITTTTTIPGMPGELDLGTRYGPRLLHASFIVKAVDRIDYSLLRTEIFRIFDSRQPFYLINDEEPQKRWLVKYESPYSINRLMSTLGEFDIVFKSSSPYAESIGSLLDPFTFENGLWQVGLNLQALDIKYKHNARRFSIWNIGDEVVDPRNRDVEILFKGASNNLVIRNETTGDEFQYYDSSKDGDTIQLDRVFFRKNGSSITSRTNKGLIRLVPGENIITVSGVDRIFEITFDFPFLFM